MNKPAKIILISSLFLLSALASWVFLQRNSSKKIVFENLTVNTTKETALFETVSFISPHHLVAQKLIENIFQKASEVNKNSEVKRVILLSPNHGNVGYSPGIISQNSWDTNFGKIEPDRDALGILLKENDISSLSDEAFENEHGIKNLLPFVKKYFPEAKIVPIMLRDGLSAEKEEKIADLLAKNFSQDTVLILSADFSHYIGKTASKMHDQASLQAIQSFDYAKIENLDVDCRGGLAILEKYSEKLGFLKFNFGENSNSSSIYGQNFGEENTSYLTGYFSRGEKQEKAKIANFLFLGDFMLDREMRTLINRQGINWPTKKIQRLFWSQDANILNLESPITDKDSVSVGSQETEKRHFVFTSDPNQTKLFFDANRINNVNIGNNHIANWGKDGLEQTENNLSAFKMGYFGDPANENNFLAQEVNGLKVVFVSYNQFSAISPEKISEKIKELKKENDLVIVYAHWGAEYQLQENEKQKNLAHSFIDSGADLIIGSHPHVIQPVEIYKNKAIFYSLGNFIFDQYFSEDVKNRLAVGVSIFKEKVDFYLVPLYVERNGQIILADNSKRTNLLERLAKDSTASQEDKNNIKNGNFTILNDK